MERLNLNLLPIALALYDERSVSGAAKALKMSQPAVSMALRKLREHFNDPLFIRAARGVDPTPRARLGEGCAPAAIAAPGGPGFRANL